MSMSSAPTLTVGNWGMVLGDMPQQGFGSDNVHPNAVGHQWISDRLVTALYGGR